MRLGGLGGTRSEEGYLIQDAILALCDGSIECIYPRLLFLWTDCQKDQIRDLGERVERAMSK